MGGMTTMRIRRFGTTRRDFVGSPDGEALTGNRQ